MGSVSPSTTPARQNLPISRRSVTSSFLIVEFGLYAALQANETDSAVSECCSLCGAGCGSAVFVLGFPSRAMELLEVPRVAIC